MKETFYFPHDYNPRSDDKIKPLVRKFGMLGYGAFWAIIEDLYNNANALRTDYECIAFELRIDEKIVKSIINDFDLFVINDNFFGSLSVQRRLEERNAKSKKARESALNRWNKDANVMRTHSERIEKKCERNAIKERKEKEIKIDINNTFREKPEKVVKIDFIEQIILLFSEQFLKYRGVEYFISNQKIERSMAGKLLKAYKQNTKNAGKTSAQTLTELSDFFEKCMLITDPWINQNMSLPIVISKFNQIINILKNGNAQRKNEPATSNEQLASVFAKHFASDYPG